MVGRFLAMAALGSLLLTGCGTKVDVPDMSSMGTINVVSREEGSGTKTEFDNLVDTDATGTNTVADSTDNVISQVASDKNAIGYIAYSAENNSGVKVLDVDGTAPDTASVERINILCAGIIYWYTVGNCQPWQRTLWLM